MESNYTTYAAYGLVVVTIASDDASYAAVDQADLEDWVDYFGITHPVLADPGYTQDPLYDPSGRTRPTYVLLEPGMTIVEIGSYTQVTAADIEAVLPIAYP